MNSYETIMILKPTLTEEETKATTEKIEELKIRYGSGK